MSPPRLGNPVAWLAMAGINVFWPFGGPVASGQTYLADPYTASSSGPFAGHMTSAVIAQVLAAGFDHVRLQVSPGPWLQLASTGWAALDAALDAAVNAMLAAGLKVLLSPYPSGYLTVDSPTAMLQGLGTAAYLTWKAVLVHWAARYAALSPMAFAIELMNEPPAPASFPASWQASVQPDLYAAVRAAAPNLTIVLTAENYSSLYLLSGQGTPASGLSIAPFDTNVLYTFHPFLPSTFVLQGAAYQSRYKYITDMRYPPVAGDQAGVLARMTANVNADTAANVLANTGMTQAAFISNLTTEIGYFYSLPQNGAWLSAQFDYVTTWLQANGLSPSSIYVGEWGAVRQGSWTDSAGLAQGQAASRVQPSSATSRARSSPTASATPSITWTPTTMA